MSATRARVVGVIGAAAADAELAQLAEAVGCGIARRGWVLVCGGRGGVMEAASRGAAESGGTVVGILPCADPDGANPWVTIPIATGLGQARNAVIACTAQVLLAVGGGYGTLSEIGHGLKAGRPVVVLRGWDIPGVHRADTAEEALALADRLSRPSRPTP